SQQETNIEVQMGPHPIVPRRLMYAEIKDILVHWRNGLDARFLARLAKRNGEQVRFPIGMTPKLNPAIELAMVRQKHALHGGVEQPRRTGHMPDEMGILETVRMLADEGLCFTEASAFEIVEWRVAGEFGEQPFAMHRRC